MYRIIGADGNQYGPVTAEQLKQWIQEGRANAQSRIAAEGTTDWKPLSSFPELAALLGNVQPPTLPASGAYRPAVPPGGKVPTYLAPAILCTLFCCLPLGIPAIVFAAQVNSKLNAGDYEGAVASSRKARMWCWLSAGLGLGFSLLYFIIFFVFGFAQSMRHGM